MSKYCKECERLAPDHAENCPLCPESNEVFSYDTFRFYDEDLKSVSLVSLQNFRSFAAHDLKQSSPNEKLRLFLIAVNYELGQRNFKRGDFCR